jgi:hypothetical protein
MPTTRLASYIFRLRSDQVDGFYYDEFEPATHRLGDYSWCASIRKTLVANNCSEHWDRRFVPANWGAVAKRLTNSHEIQHARAAFAGKSTLQLYQSLPRSPGKPEQWMNRTLAHPGVRIKVMMRGNCAPVFERVGATRAYDIPRHSRKCKFCALDAVENVTHVVSACPCYADLRQSCLQRLDTCLNGQNIPDGIMLAIADRSPAGLTRLFLGDVFQGLSSELYQKTHGIVLNYLKLLWKRRTDFWIPFCVPGDEWKLLNPPEG